MYIKGKELTQEEIRELRKGSKYIIDDSIYIRSSIKETHFYDNKFLKHAISNGRGNSNFYECIEIPDYKVGNKVEMLVNGLGIKGGSQGVVTAVNDCAMVVCFDFYEYRTFIYTKNIYKYITLIQNKEEDNKMKEFTKSDLKSGMVVEMRSDDKYLVVGDILVHEISGFTDLEDYENNLLVRGIPYEGYDIMKVYEIQNYEICRFKDKCAISYSNPIWERNEIAETDWSKTDWSKVEVDTLIEVEFKRFDEIRIRHFKKYAEGKIWCYASGASSVTSNGTILSFDTNEAKLYKGEK